MAKLKNVVLQLSEEDYRALFNYLLENNAEKSAFLLKYLKEEKFSDAEIMDKLEVNSNAYYTLRSRLNQKIEEYLLQQLENPRADLLRKVANISEVVFTKNRTIAIATLKKLESELLSYDLSSQLTVVYKYLKKLHIDTPEYYEYSQHYNRHVAYMLAVDKVEALVNEYFSKFGHYSLNGEQRPRIESEAYLTEIINAHKLYESHRLQVYLSMVYALHKLYVDPQFENPNSEESIPQLFKKVEAIFEEFFIDPIYFNLKHVFELLRFLYYTEHQQPEEAEKHLNEVNEHLPWILENFSYYTSPGLMLMAKVKYAQQVGQAHLLEEQAEKAFAEYVPDPEQFTLFTYYHAYRALACYLNKNYNGAAKWLNQLLNELSFKNHTLAHMEIKLFLSLQYTLMDEYDLFQQIMNSLQRQIRIYGEEACPNVAIGAKLVKLIGGKNKKNLDKKMSTLIEQLRELEPQHLALMHLVDLDELKESQVVKAKVV